MRGIYWFRHDLRIDQNAALHEASRSCRDGVLAIYYIPYETWKSHGVAACQVEFVLRHLPLLKASLDLLNIPFQVRLVKSFDDCVTDLISEINKNKIDALYFNREYEWDERKRDEALELALKKTNCKSYVFEDHVITSPEKILSGKGQPYTVFTPFRKSAGIWLSVHDELICVGRPEVQAVSFASASELPESVPGYAKSLVNPALWPAGEAEAQKRLDNFIENGLNKYDEARNFPAQPGTSQLSPYLNLGIISPRYCFERALTANCARKEGIDSWISELLWRDFYKYISFHFPRVCKNQPFLEQYQNFAWDDRPEWVEAWKKGETGFPLVDAAMKQLHETGWMHNRLRMLVAMFFCKLMYQDWRIGERFFIEHLIDGDFSSNNGGWQWSSATGTDAAPYFRIFNPTRQIKNYDPEAEFIHHYLPALRSLSSKNIQNLSPELCQSAGYPLPILSYEEARKSSLDRFFAFKGRSRRGRPC